MLYQPISARLNFMENGSVTHNLESWRLRTKVYHKTDDFNSRCELSIHSNIAATPAYGVYISQLIRHSRAYGSYQDILNRGLLLTRVPIGQVEVVVSKVLRSPP